jgi:phosphoglycolate phosphatase-like HAD superfamily hydrolase
VPRPIFLYPLLPLIHQRNKPNLAHYQLKCHQQYPGVREGLDYMKAQGYTLGCVTNKAEQFTLPILKDLGIFDERNIKYYAKNIFLIFFMYFQKRETIF